MAQDYTVRGVQVRERNPWVTWLLALVTLGVYGFVYWYKINRELRDASAAWGQPFGNDPVLAVLAVTLGALIIVPPIMSAIYTARRVRAMEELVAPDVEWGGQPSSGLTVLLELVGGFHLIYVQSYLNRIWERGRAQDGEAPVAS